jgi:hypothetical protein
MAYEVLLSFSSRMATETGGRLSGELCSLNQYNQSSHLPVAQQLTAKWQLNQNKLYETFPVYAFP